MEWVQPASCQHPDHVQPKGKKAPVTRAVPIELIEFMVKEKENMKFPIGGKFCIDHLKLQTLQCAASNVVEPDIGVDDQLYMPDEPIVSPENVYYIVIHVIKVCRIPYAY